MKVLQMVPNVAVKFEDCHRDSESTLRAKLNEFNRGRARIVVLYNVPVVKYSPIPMPLVKSHRMQ